MTDFLYWKPPEPPKYGGDTFDEHRDGDRLNAQCKRVRNLMVDGAWRSLPEIAAMTGDPEASISARLRDLRKPEFGAHSVERQYVAAGLWRYRLGQPKSRVKAKSR